MTRSAAIAQAITDELAAKRAVLDLPCGPKVLTLVVRIDGEGRPYVAVFRPEWELKPRARAS